jgi:hypothetical protein
MILFLDFDGVLHPEPCYDQTMLFCRRSLLEDCLRDFPDVQIVITSTWRERHSFDALRALFATDIAARIIDVTPQWSDLLDLRSSMSYMRQVEVMGWLRQNGEPWTQWVALDDKPWLFKPFLSNLVTCDGEVGLDEGVLQKLRSKLAQMAN